MPVQYEHSGTAVTELLVHKLVSRQCYVRPSVE